MFCSPGKTRNELEAEMVAAEKEVVCESHLGTIICICHPDLFLDYC